MSSADVIIAGAGIIGLSTAIELARRGMHVTVLERGQAMTEASWAAAGMLAADDPENLAELRSFSRLSISLYPDYLNTIEQLSGLHVPLRTSSTLQAVEADHGSQTILSREGLKLHAPDLNPEKQSFCLLREHSLDPRDLCMALPKAAVAAGVALVEQSPVTMVCGKSSGVEVATPQITWSGAHFINCCGAWAGGLASLPYIEPRKGQMVTVKLPANRHLDCVVRTSALYLVPRGDGRVVIGASVEREGFDKTVHEATIQTMLDEAAALWPPIREGQIVETWAGLRPGSADQLPLIGPWGDENCWIASGHFRNGILLAPATARVMRELLQGEDRSVDLTAFRCDRFAAMPVS